MVTPSHKLSAELPGGDENVFNHFINDSQNRSASESILVCALVPNHYPEQVLSSIQQY